MLFSILFFVGFGVGVIQASRPLLFAGGYALLSGVLSLVGGAGPLPSALSALLLFAVAGFVYSAMDYWRRSLPIQVALLVGAAVVLGGLATL